MKEKSLQLKKVTSIALFALLMAVFAPLAMMGQDELTVFEGTQTNYYAPMYVYYFDDYTRAQTVYPATELEDMVGAELTAIKFYTTSSNIPYTTVSSFDIYLTEVDETSISSFVDRGDATTVYSGTGEFVATNNGGEITITFSEPYVYQGSNLLFGCDNITDSGFKQIDFYGQTVSGASISGSNGTAGSTINPTQRNFIPKTTFTYTRSCPRPTDLAVMLDDSDATIATMNWTESGEAINWVLQTATNPTFTESLQEYEVSDNPTKDLTGLVPETRYYARVKANCGNEESNWSNVINFRPSNTIPLTLNEGTTTNEFVPIFGYYVDEYQKSEFIIPATTDGLEAMTDGIINQMTFYLSQPASDLWENAQFQVFMKEVTATEFSTDYLGNLFHGSDDATIVYEGPLDGTQPTMVIDFTTTYHYNGGNLLVGVYETIKGTYKRSYFVGNTAVGGSIREKNSSSLESITTGTVEDFLPKTTFNYLPSNTPKPANLQAQNISSNGAILSWTAAANNVIGYQYQYKTYNGDWTTLQSTTSTSVSLSDLMDLTSYTFQVKAIYSEGESDFASITFSTKQIPVLVDLEHSFEDDFEGEQCDWVLMNGNLTNAWAWGTAVSNGGEHALYISNDGGTSNAYTTSGASALVYAVKSFTLEQGMHVFTFDWRANGENNYDYLRVALIPDEVELIPFDYLPSGLSYSQLPEGWVALDGGTKLNLSTEWISHIEEIEVPVAGEYKMAFIWRNDGSQGSNPPAAIDNISISKVSCQTPMDLNYSNLTPFTATLGWSPNGSETSWEIEYRMVGENEWQIETVYENPYTLEGLNELTTYEARVRAVCEGGAAATLPITFTTKQIPVLVDLEHPFEDGFEGEQCDWVLMNGDLTNAWTWGTAVNNGGEHAIYISNDEGVSNAYSTNASALVYAVKSFTLEQGAYDFSYDWMANGESTYDYLRVALIPDAEEISSSTELPSDLGYNTLPSGWIALDGGTQLNLSTEWNTRFEGIVVPVAGEYKMAFIWRNDNTAGNNPPAAIDNISISQVSCLMPTELSHIGVSSSSVTLNWTVNGTGEAWEIEYRAEGESEWQMVTVYENPYILEGLNENTTYELRIRAVCSGATTTTQPIAFTTDCVAYEITEENPLFEDFEGYTGTTDMEEGEVPTCWKNYSEISILPHIITCSGDCNYAHSGTNALYFYGAGDSYVALPKISNNLNGLFISFWMQASSRGILSLGYISNDDDDFSTFEEIVTIDNPNQSVFYNDPENSMVLRGVYLHDIPTTADRLAFRWLYWYDGGFWRYGCCIDDVEISMTNVFTGTESNDWNTAANWSANNVPAVTDNVLINADAIISTEAEANVIVIGSGSLTIADGGQLQHNNAGVQATTQRTIITYTGEKDNYYLIASPMTNGLIVSDEAQTNLIANDYDLYMFDQYQDLEWRNYKNDEFTNISNGTGYLYANSGEEGQTSYSINFSGELEPSNADKSVNIYNYSNMEFAGWNLVGNPFACNAYIGQDFYRLGEGAVDATPASGAIAPMEGIFVKHTGTTWIGSITFSRNEPEESGNKGALNVNVMRKGKCVDLARVRFGNGRDLEKFQLNPRHTKVFIPQNGKDYAVAYSENNAGEIPLSFKAEENGSYTLDFSNEEVIFDYLHLIDNITGADVDLLNIPSYTFTAKTTDYESRFKLVFATGNNSNEDNFAFFCNGSFVISNEGDAILQVVDVMGRIIKAENINGCTNVNVDAASGVYMLRLVNGNNVKVQKVVVK